MELVVGVDMATAAVRALAADATGKVHADGAEALPAPGSDRPGRSEQDAAAWAPAVMSVLRQVAERLGPDAPGVVALTVCATSGTVVALDDEGEPVGPALMYADQRARAEAEEAQRAGAERWRRLGLRVQPSFGLPKWAWLCRHAAAHHGRPVAALAHASDLVVRRLVGSPVPTDWSHALKSGYDAERTEWAGEALDALGIDHRLVPDVVPPTTGVGRLSPEAADATGLPAACQVRLGMTDACAAQLAAGAGSPGRFVSVLGTTLAVKGASRDLVTDPSGAVYSHRHPQGWWLPGGASSTGGGVLAASFPDADLAALDERAAARGPARTVTYPLVGTGERFPFVAPDAEGFVLGERDDDAERFRSVLEGVAFVERLAYERLRELGATVEPPVAASGRASASPVWNRIRATVLGAPLVAKPDAGTALGACILAAAGTLHADVTEAAGAMGVDGRLVDPVEDERAALDDGYGRFLEALRNRGWVD